MRTSANVNQEINLGAEICTKIKQWRYPKEEWQTVHRQVAADLTALKRQAITFYPNDSPLELLAKIRTWDTMDFQDALGGLTEQGRF